MSEIAIKVESISKKYTIGSKSSGSLRETLVNNWQKLTSRTKTDVEEFWALKDVSFEVKQGEVLGVIGKNGAGKSTLLKILSRITEPTSGNAEIYGRVSSLLEVGTGFHPELNGRENIFLNGTILGMSRKEVKSKFDEIVDFSGVEKFIDTPVKHYSSGMYVRLAFAVAAHLEPEILIIDEVLAVGDAEFQKKCLGKMKDVSEKDGRTVIFVSHSMTSIQTLCNSALYLENGSSQGTETVKSAVNKYLGGNWTERSLFERIESDKNKDAFIIHAEINNSAGVFCETFPVYEDIYIKIHWKNISGVKVNPNFMLMNRQGVCAMIALDAPIDWSGELKKEKGEYISIAKIPGNLLNANDYFLHLALDCGSPRLCYDSVLDALSFNIWDPMDEKCLGRGNFTSVREDAILFPALEWKFNKFV